jgi:hypothetical protein
MNPIHHLNGNNVEQSLRHATAHGTRAAKVAAAASAAEK